MVNFAIYGVNAESKCFHKRKKKCLRALGHTENSLKHIFLILVSLGGDVLSLRH